MRATARPGRRRSIAAATGDPTTSSDSSSADIRRAMRRLVLARIWPVITPAGRWVARTRCRPRLRPRSATSTTPSTNSGTSLARAANSSTTMSRLGGVSGMALALHLEEILGVGLLEQQLAVVELGVERDQRPPHLVAVEVGDQPDGVRQFDALLERGATLVVDEQERDPLGTVHRGQPGDERLEELALAGAGGAGDEGVRAVLPDVEHERGAGLHADDDAQAVAVPASLVLLPELEDRRRVVEDVRPAVELGERHRARDLAVVVDPAGDVDDRREVAGDGDGVGERHALPAGRADREAAAGEAGPGGDVVGIDLDHRPARLRAAGGGPSSPR